MQALHCCAGFSLVSESRGYSLVAVRELPVVTASPVAEHRLYGAQASVVTAHGLNGHGAWALEHRLGGCGAPA